MHLKRFSDAKPYDAPNHRGVIGLRLQGFEDGGPENQWVGFSQFLHGGGAGPVFTRATFFMLMGATPQDN